MLSEFLGAATKGLRQTSPNIGLITLATNSLANQISALLRLIDAMRHVRDFFQCVGDGYAVGVVIWRGLQEVAEEKGVFQDPLHGLDEQGVQVPSSCEVGGIVATFP